MKKELKLVVIGGGSSYTPEIIEGIIQRGATLPIKKMVLVDISEDGAMERAAIVAELGRRMIHRAGIDCSISLTDNRQEALQNADFVISQLRVGQMHAREMDELTGIDLNIIGQETTGVGGFLNALRTIPIALQIAEDIKKICPEAWLINFTNPAGIITQAIHNYSDIRCVGLCNVPINMQHDIASSLGVNDSEIHCEFAGLNHLSYVLSAVVDGHEVLPEVINSISNNFTKMKNIPQVSGTDLLIKDINMLPSPYLQYYYFEKEMLGKQQEEYILNRKTRAIIVEEVNNTLFKKYANPEIDIKPPELSERGGSLYSEAAFNVMEALVSDEPIELAVNYLNNGKMPQLDCTDVIEANFLISNKGIKPSREVYLPTHAIGLVRQIKCFEQITVRAAVEHSRSLALQAMLAHPLIHGYTNAQAVMDIIATRYKDLILPIS